MRNLAEISERAGIPYRLLREYAEGLGLKCGNSKNGLPTIDRADERQLVNLIYAVNEGGGLKLGFGADR